MASGYKIFWTDHALIELAETYKYLEENFSEIELKRLSVSIEKYTQFDFEKPKIISNFRFKRCEKGGCKTLQYVVLPRSKSNYWNFILFLQ